MQVSDPKRVTKFLLAWFYLVLGSWAFEPIGSAQEPAPGASLPKGFTARSSRLSQSRVKVHFDVSYCQQNDPLQLADVYMPAAGDMEHQAKFPAILAIHGGAWVAGDKRFDALHCRKMAEQGYVVMAINYRLAPKHKHPAQIEDCREALRWLRDHAQEYHIDPEKLGVWGYSAGGHLAALLATDRKTEDPSIRVCVAGGAPVDLRMIPEDSRALAGFLGGTRRALQDVYLKASPIEHVSSDDPPMMLYHGDADELVPISFASKMHKKLQETGVTCEYVVLPGRSHIMAFVDTKGINRSIEFLDRYLK
ncbi:MAG: alpha/beta hydrolase [Planctomycetes bacterium]|nr:alpha/beta hydrolase [Planctomycetota bacterium]